MNCSICGRFYKYLELFNGMCFLCALHSGHGNKEVAS